MRRYVAHVVLLASVRCCAVCETRACPASLTLFPTLFPACLPACQLHAKVDSVEGVSACIIMGSPMELGTGSFKLLHKQPEHKPLKKRSLLLGS